MQLKLVAEKDCRLTALHFSKLVPYPDEMQVMYRLRLRQLGKDIAPPGPETFRCERGERKPRKIENVYLFL